MNIRTPSIRVFFLFAVCLAAHELIKFSIGPLLLLFKNSFTQYGVHEEFLIIPMSFFVSFLILRKRQITDYLMEVQAELAKISWASNTELLNCTMFVVLFITVFSAYLYACDLVWGTMLVLFGVLIA